MATSTSHADNPSETTSLKEGTVVVYEHEGQPQLGVVTDCKGQKLRILTMRCRDIDLPLSRVDSLPTRIPSAHGSSNQEKARFLLIQRDDALNEAPSFPTEELWSFIHEEEREYSVHELATLYFGEHGLREHLILRFALYEDSIFFKRKRNSFIPRAVSTVEELQRAEAARREKERLLNVAMEELLQINTQAQSVKTFDHLSQSTLELIKKIERVAATCQHIDNNEVKEVAHFLEHYESRTSTSRSGSREERAYHFLRTLGWFHSNTNLSFIRNDLRTRFPQALEETAQLLTFSPEALSIHEDSTHLHCITIDDSDTKDMDDALSLEVLEDGYRLGIHISDVASLIPLDSPLDLEARSRATSLYFPEGTFHMFPEKIAEQTASLCADQVRPALSCFIELDSLFQVRAQSLRLTKIQVSERMSYSHVDALLDPPSGQYDTLYQIASEFESRRIANGGMKIPKREVQIVLSHPNNIRQSDFAIEAYSDQTPAREFIGEMMVMANEFMALFARENEIPFIYRSQEPSDATSESRLIGVPPGPAYDAALRGTLKRSRTSTVPDAHATLGLSNYAQVTSPIRRYLDLANQRQLVSFLKGEPLPYDADALESLIQETAAALQSARTMGRDTHRFWVLKHLKRKAKKKETICGVVVRNDGPQYQVELEEVFIPVLVKSRLKLQRGDSVELTIQSVEPHQDYVRFHLKKTTTND